MHLGIDFGTTRTVIATAEQGRYSVAAFETEAGFSDAVRLARGGTPARELLTALPLELAGTIGLAGDAAAVRSRLAAYADAGVDEIAVVPVTGGDPGGERTLSALQKIIK